MSHHQPSAFGLLLRQYRMAAGLTQEALAERGRISARTVSDLERGVIQRPQVHTATQLADALDLSDRERSWFIEAARTGHVSPEFLQSANALLLAASGAGTQPAPGSQK